MIISKKTQELIDKNEAIDQKRLQLVLDTPNPEKLTKGLGRYEGFKKLIEYFNVEFFMELGVREAYFSNYLLKNTKLKLIRGIDIDNCPNAINLQNSCARYTFKQKDAIIAAKEFPNNCGYLGTIHLDDCHKYYHVKKELNTWYYKVKPGNMITGDDFMEYFCYSSEGQFGVTEAVFEFVKSKGLQLYIIGLDETNLDRINEYARYVGDELRKKAEKKPHNFIESPNFFIFKT